MGFRLTFPFMRRRRSTPELLPHVDQPHQDRKTVLDRKAEAAVREFRRRIKRG